MSSPQLVRGTRPEPSEHAPFYATYIGKSPDGDVVATLTSQIGETLAFLRAIPEVQGGHRYAPGKWSIREVIGHLSDCERIFCYRALAFARADDTVLPGFDENRYVDRAAFDARTVADLCDEYEAVRTATVAFFRPLNADEWMRLGAANGKPFSVRALAWIVAGHELHHREIIRTRYL